MIFSSPFKDKLFILIAIILLMLPATFLWALAMGGLQTSVRMAIGGNPLTLFFIVAGASGIIGIANLYRVVAFNARGRLISALAFVIPAWVALAIFIVMNPTFFTFSIVVGPIIISIVLLYLGWERLSYK
ncbi:MAG: hypothetical protein HRT38_18840 [Alteromonadaceae bacterium]|nr:hypothetical protein [Alteromonadaceae bacterium]